MSNKNHLTVVLAAVASALVGAYIWAGAPSGSAVAADAIDHSGPKMEITVSGEANGTILVQLFEDVAPKHVERITTLVGEGAYDGVVFHRVIEGFMAQSGDVEFGKMGGDMRRAGMGGSSYPDLAAEFSDVNFDRGVLGMARSQSPDSANSQFFIMFSPATHLNGQYTIIGNVIEGLDVLDAIKLGKGANGAVIGEPDMMKTVTIVD